MKKERFAFPKKIKVLQDIEVPNNNLTIQGFTRLEEGTVLEKLIDLSTVSYESCTLVNEYNFLQYERRRFIRLLKSWKEQGLVEFI